MAWIGLFLGVVMASTPTPLWVASSRADWEACLAAQQWLPVHHETHASTSWQLWQYNQPESALHCTVSVHASWRQFFDKPVWSFWPQCFSTLQNMSIDAKSLVLAALQTGIAHRPPAHSHLDLEVRHGPLLDSLRTDQNPKAEIAVDNPLWCPTRVANQVLPTTPARTVLWRQNRPTRKIALTFDACSTFHTGSLNPAVIGLLIRERVPATLFVGGHWAELHPEIVTQLAQNPLFEIGNHSFSHPHLVQMPAAAIDEELIWTQTLLRDLTGKTPRLFRPPYGEVTQLLVDRAYAWGLYTVQYDIPTGDPDEHLSVAQLMHWVSSRLQPGSMLVLHMNRPHNKTAALLEQLLPFLRAQKLTPTTVSDLFDLPPS